MDETNAEKKRMAGAITDTANRIGMLMVDAVNGVTGEKITWDAAVFAAALAIRGLASSVRDMRNLSDEEMSAAIHNALVKAFEGELDLTVVARRDLAERLGKKPH
jgi:hypothetical protein